MEFTRKEFDTLRSIVTQLEYKVRALEEKVKVLESKIKPQELYRVMKTEEKGKEIEKHMGVTEKPL